MKKAYEEAVINNTVEAFLKDNGCDATIEDIKAFFKKLQGDKALSEEDIDKIAGGKLDGEAYHPCFPMGVGPIGNF